MKALFLSMFVVLFVSCGSDDSTLKDYTAENEQDIVDYIAENNLNATATGSGLYYVIDEAGTGGFPTSSSNVTVIYKGYYTNGNVFDPGNPDGISFSLNQVISGWTEGITYFNEGAKGMLLIPAHLGYGSGNYNSIPGGSVLIFDIDLQSIN
jgi:FKBP-type peptidyl-prolyl cis-trans isomerase FkpA